MTFKILMHECGRYNNVMSCKISMEYKYCFKDFLLYFHLLVNLLEEVNSLNSFIEYIKYTNK